MVGFFNIEAIVLKTLSLPIKKSQYTTSAKFLITFLSDANIMPLFLKPWNSVNSFFVPNKIYYTLNIIEQKDDSDDDITISPNGVICCDNDRNDRNDRNILRSNKFKYSLAWDRV